VRFPARYRIRGKDEPVPLLTAHIHANKTFYLVYGVDDETRNPDWLAEIFEWLSCGHEVGRTARDSIGRFPFSDSVFSRQGISPRQPHAMLMMSWLESLLRCGGSSQGLPKAPSPVPGVEHFVICSHDVDFLYTGKLSSLLRLCKNLAISIWPYRSWSFFVWNLRQILAVVAGRRIGEYLRPLHEASREYDFQSTVFVVSNRAHRRDPNYRIEDVARQLAVGVSPGFSVGLHGSYTSSIEAGDLASEARAIESSLATKPLGNRQHWLRFGDHEQFFRTLEDAGFLYDSTLGFSETPGFRNGACFAFPPYDFKNERPYPFLEIPLVLMDGNVEADSRSSGEKADAIANEVLESSRRWGWGGISALWHNPIEPVQVPESINSIFWDCVRNQRAHQEKWISADEFLRLSLKRYQDAGLLLGARIDA